MELTIHIFLNNRIIKNPFSKKERTVVENGITTIRPYRNGKPSSTNREIEIAFDELKQTFDRPSPVDFDLEDHNRSY